MTNIRRKHILCKINDIPHGKNVKCKLCKKPNKYCNEDNCYTTASFNFKIDDRPIKCKNHKENNMINVKRKYIVNNNSKIKYKKGNICENNKKGGVIKNNEKSKNNEIVKNNEENDINEEYLYDPDPKFTEDELKQIYADDDDDEYFIVKDVVGKRKSEWDRLKLFPYICWRKDCYGLKNNADKKVIKYNKIKDIENKVNKTEKNLKK